MPPRCGPPVRRTAHLCYADPVRPSLLRRSLPAARRWPIALATLLTCGIAWAAGAPADRLPDPRPEPCRTVTGDPEEGEMLGSQGLSYEEVIPPLQRVIQTALYCPRPAGRDALALTYELVIGCDGRVSTVECSADDDAPAEYVSCVAAVLAKADFPAHDMPDGMPLTYPVDVAW